MQPLEKIPLVKRGDDLSKLILKSAKKQNIEINDNDILVIAQSIVSKSENNIINLNQVKPSEKALEISKKINKDSKIVEVILQQTEEIIRLEHVLISKTRHGFICANAGVDSSNIESNFVTVLPENPDASARAIRRGIQKKTDSNIAVIISDSWGRPFRLGAVGFAIGVAGIKSTIDLQGREDAYGNKLETTMISPPDSIAAAASLVMGESDERVPAVLVKNAPYEPGEGSIQELLRKEDEDLFR
ncbi:hypothetical protein AKJ49_00945 [candidate division MSBL1 archaeon SCGC-AAA382A03]|uniref:Coenzyme F420:L-glutamate ligase-like domain-containing protein n=1 Tax=candidate division MSBL1 archaeon SCGC-AAA382A03 TaxID=1698278 RepID=A0A133VG06_9EURY|nr:hypothetical protein AKJ49_00945 [candidate division MSBL1 archaeon SCGC-AAA382A03]